MKTSIKITEYGTNSFSSKFELIIPANTENTKEISKKLVAAPTQIPEKSKNITVTFLISIWLLVTFIPALLNTTIPSTSFLSTHKSYHQSSVEF